MFVYNIETDACREVTMTPNAGWGGEGSIGCDIGYGYLHRIPTSMDRSKPVPVMNQGVPEVSYLTIIPYFAFRYSLVVQLETLGGESDAH